MNNGRIVRNVDVVFCIDGTRTMEAIIDSVREWAKEFCRVTKNEIERRDANMGTFRVKLIIFRDYGYDDAPMDISEWLELPKDEELFSDRLNGITPSGGGDHPENGLEALWYAMKSDFVTGRRDLQIIVLITDADALDLGERIFSPNYPADMGSLADLVSIWMGMVEDPNLKLQQRNKRLIMIAPAKTQYEELVGVLEGSMFRPIDPENGLANIKPEDLFNIA